MKIRFTKDCGFTVIESVDDEGETTSQYDETFIKDEVMEGDIVDVLDNQGHYLATGHYQIGSIAVRMFAFKKTKIDRDFWKNKLSKFQKPRRVVFPVVPGFNY